jgi:hypothetical protein
MSILVRTTRFVGLQLQNRTLKMRRGACVFGMVALFVFLSPSMQIGKWSGATLAKSPQVQKDPVVIKVGNQVLTESAFREWLKVLKARTPVVDYAPDTQCSMKFYIESRAH